MGVDLDFGQPAWDSTKFHEDALHQSFLKKAVVSSLLRPLAMMFEALLPQK
jgi:hypothetical protein